MRHLVLLSLVFFTACRGGQLSQLSEELVVPESVDCGQGFVGFGAPCAVPVSNRSRTPVSLHLQVGAPFEAPAVIELAAGEAVELPVVFRPQSVGDVGATLELTGVGGVALQGVGLAVPDCTSTVDCVERTFDASAGGCVERVAADGSGCGGQDRCIVNGVCRAGVCTGSVRSCDDGDACTTDACDAARGCVHDAVVCAASTNPCQAALCDARTGCRLEPVLDGTACGSNDCVTADVCMAGQCVQRPAPEGSTCAPATACRGEGRCTAQGTCDVPEAGSPREAWRFVLPPNRWVQRSAIAPSGDVFLVHGMDVGVMMPGPLVLVSFDRTGQRRFEIDLTAEDGNVQYGIQLMIDEPNRRLFVVSRTYSPTAPGQHVAFLAARDSTTGALLWKRDLRALGIPVTNSDTGALVLDVQGLASVGQGDVLALIVEGGSIHQQHLVAFEGSSGAERWRSHRPGHGGFGVTGAGEVWMTWAPCWSWDNRLSRFDGAGQTAAEVPIDSNPLAMSGNSALLQSDGGLAILAPDLVSRRQLPLPSGHRPDPWAGLTWADGEVTTVTQSSRPVLARIDADAGTLLWTAPIDPTVSWKTLRLVADGGIALSLSQRDGGFGLELWSKDGEQLDRCQLNGHNVGGLAAGRLYSVERTAVVAFDLPGVRAAPNGWSGQGGLDGTLRSR